ncbi:hypothetical protein PARA125_000664 [Parachlamydia sp. AcF125]|nr:hypothetical protein [Parachlamydia sp. AcF125]
MRLPLILHVKREWIETIATGLKKRKDATSCHYEKIYSFFQGGDKSDIIFANDGQWDPKVALNLTSEDRAKILILFIPTDKKTEERFHIPGYFSCLFAKGGGNSPLHLGMNFKVLYEKDFKEIQTKKYPETLVKALISRFFCKSMASSSPIFSIF